MSQHTDFRSVRQGPGHRTSALHTHGLDPARRTGPTRLDAPPPPEHLSAVPTARLEEVAPAPGPARAAWMRLTRFSVGRLLVTLDVLAITAGIGVHAALPMAHTPTADFVAFGAVLLGLLWSGGLYRSRLSLSVLVDVPALVGRCFAALGIATLAQVSWAELNSTRYDATWSHLGGAVIIGALIVVFRAVGYAVVRTVRSRGVVAHPTLIVGAGLVGNQLADVLRTHPEYGLLPIGFLDVEPPDTFKGRLPVPVLGGPESFTRVLREHGVRTVVVAFSAMKESEMVTLIRTCDRYSCELFVVPRLFELHQVDTHMDNAWGFPLVRLRRATYRSRSWRLKRLVDVLVAGLALVLTAPILLAVAAAVRLDGGGREILFRQERVGVDGYRFQLLKFRSLRPATESESATTWNIGDDPRLTRVGRFLRKTSLDELPQLYNVLRGDMSLVGPRPERPYFVSQFRSLYPSYEARHRVPSGLTGWAQVHGLRGDTSIAERARFDNYYIENWSLWLDATILVRTLSSVFRGAGR